MRLLNTTTGRFHLIDDPRKVRYAILSHVWSQGPQKEKTNEDVQSISPQLDQHPIDDPSFPQKTRSFCEVAKCHGFDFGWADSCCIDKTSSSELAEAIASMYDCYRYADTCFAFLHDVDVGQGLDAAGRNQAICESQWFSRGWTLQELVAPPILLFFSSTWDAIASKQTCATQIARIFQIDRDVLTFKRPLDEVSVARKMSWAASRKTTRKEDAAYCLMGIFGVNIPIIYGEGRHAFVRLQEEIIRTIPDQSIFAWGRILRLGNDQPLPFQFQRPNAAAVESVPDSRPSGQVARPPTDLNRYLLASSPKDFRNSPKSPQIIHISHDEFVRRLAIPLKFTYQVFTATAYGIHVRLPLVAIVVGKDHHELFPTHLALLACETQVDRSLLALLLRPKDGNPGFSVGATVVESSKVASLAKAGFEPADLTDGHYRAIYLSLDQVDDILRGGLLEMANLYLPHRPLRGVGQTERDYCRLFRSLRDSQDNFEVQLSNWSRKSFFLDGLGLKYSREDGRIVRQDRHGLHPGRIRVVPQRRRLHLDQAPWLEIEYKAPSEKVYRINIQIGRCECPLGLNSGTILPGALVWSPDAQSSLEELFNQEAYHRLNHPLHLYSWAYHDGVATTNVELRPSPPSQERITVCLTLCHLPHSDQSQQSARASVDLSVFELGVEVTSFEDSDEERLLPSQTFGITSFQGAIPESPPVTVNNSKSSYHPTDSDWNANIAGLLFHQYPPQKPTKVDPRYRATLKLPNLHDNSSFSPPSPLRSFSEDRLDSHVPSPHWHAGPDDHLHARVHPSIANLHSNHIQPPAGSGIPAQRPSSPPGNGTGNLDLDVGESRRGRQELPSTRHFHFRQARSLSGSRTAKIDGDRPLATCRDGDDSPPFSDMEKSNVYSESPAQIYQPLQDTVFVPPSPQSSLDAPLEEMPYYAEYGSRPANLPTLGDGQVGRGQGRNTSVLGANFASRPKAAPLHRGSLPQSTPRAPSGRHSDGRKPSEPSAQGIIGSVGSPVTSHGPRGQGEAGKHKEKSWKRFVRRFLPGGKKHESS